MRSYLLLTKPRISLLFAITGLSALVVEGTWTMSMPEFWIIIGAIFLVGGGANALNQYFEREVDKQMARTASKRPLPQGKVSPNQALIFAIFLCLVGVILLGIFGTPLAAFLGGATIAFYSFYYTLILKPKTPYNIVIGGIGGATGPLIAWAAPTGEVSLAAFIMFLIIFFWTPPHFWALALCCKEDYATVSYPMLPNIVGEKVTKKQILNYSVILFPISLTLYIIQANGIIYLMTATLLGSVFILKALQVLKKPDNKVAWNFFGYSIVYLMLIFLAIIADKLILSE